MRMVAVSLFALVAFICADVPPVFPKIQKGTVGIAYFTEEKISMVVDSRGSDGKNKFSYDKMCKLAALGKRMVFISSGLVANIRIHPLDPTPSWSNTDEAHRAYERLKPLHPNRSFVTEVAKEWAKTIAHNISLLNSSNPQAVLDAANENGGVTSAYFGGTLEDGRLTLLSVEITVDRNNINQPAEFDPPEPVEPDKETLHVLGKSNIVHEFLFLTSARAERNARQWATESKRFTPEERQINWAIRLAELTIQHDQSGTVGGEIDALELRQGEDVRWIRLKPGCPAN